MNNTESSFGGVIQLMKLLVLLYAALVPAGLWVRSEIKSSIRDAIDNGAIVAKKELEVRDAAIRDELSDRMADNLGPVISYIATVDQKLTRVAHLSESPRPQLIIREHGKSRTWEWTDPKP